MIIQGDSRYIPLSDKSVNCIITSPPYWSLRKYDIPDLIWDGEEGCEHEWGEKIITGNLEFRAGHNTSVGVQKSPDAWGNSPSQFCLHCHAWRGQLGLEPTIDLYLKHLMQIMDECKRVLRDDGTMWVNLGDSYYTISGGKFLNDQISKTELSKAKGVDIGNQLKSNKELPQKSLYLIPERFAIEMVNRGWILRNKIVWHKPNCMPSSVKDRFTVDWEPVYFFVKSRKYWFDAHSIREPISQVSIDRISQPNFDNQTGGSKDYGHRTNTNMSARKALCNLKEKLIKQEKWGDRFEGWKQRDKSIGRNKRCVWTIPTQPYPESHFATFPETLVEPMIKAGCPQFVCEKCGKAREKIVETTQEKLTGSTGKNRTLVGCNNFGSMRMRSRAIHKEIGLTDCGCNADFRPGIVLDPFCGSGTVLRVSERLQRKAVGIDLGYQELSEKRIRENQIELFCW